MHIADAKTHAKVLITVCMDLFFLLQYIQNVTNKNLLLL